MTAAAGIFCRAWPEGAEAYVHVSGNRELQPVEVVVLGLGRSNVLVLAPREALAFAETLRRAAVEAGHAEDAP
jgi:hypothetical protein